MTGSSRATASRAGASPALLTCPRHVGRNRFAYYTRLRCPIEYSRGDPCGRPEILAVAMSPCVRPESLALEASTHSAHKEARYQCIEYDGWQRVKHCVGSQLAVVHLAITAEERINMNRSRQ